MVGYYGEVVMNKFQEKVSDALNSKNALLPCPRCGHDQFSVLDREAYIPLTKRQSEKESPIHFAIPIIAVVCENCGYLAMHSTLALGVQDDG